MIRLVVHGARFEEIIADNKELMKLKFMEKAMHHVMIQARNISKNQLCPVKTGMLRDSIYIRKTGTLTYEMGATMYYGVWHEYGSYNIQEGTVENPRLIKTGYSPFLRPALWRTIKKFPELINQYIDEIMLK